MPVTSSGRAIFLGAVAVGACPLAARGADVVGSTADRGIRTDGTLGEGTTARVGAATSTPGEGGRVAVFVFQLPAPDAPGPSPVSAADLAFTVVTDQANGAYAIDLYGLGSRAAPEVLASDRYCGPLDAAATLIQDDILPPDTTLTGAVHVSAAGAASLAAYLNAQYGPDGAGAGRYVFLRLNPDIVPPVENSGVDVAQANRSTGKPVLSVGFAPEPGGTLLVASMGGMAMARRRRRPPCRRTSA